MKKQTLVMATAALVMGFTSCNKEDATYPSTKDNNVLLVKLPGSSTRAVEEQVGSGTTATTVLNAEVFLINSGSGAVVARESFNATEISAKQKRIENVPASVNKVVVVANIPTDVPATLTAVQALPNYNAVKNYAYTIASQNITPVTGSPISNKTLMGEGIPVTSTEPNPDGHDYKAVSIALDALTSRFEIGAIKAGTGVASVDLVGVWINNYFNDGSKAGSTLNSSSSPFWTTTPATGNSDTAFTTVSLGNAYSPAEYYNAYDAQVSLSTNSKAYAFHLFSGNIIPRVIMLVKGEYEDGYYSDNQKYFLGWVTFNKYNEGTTDSPVWITSILPNYIYKVGTGATGVKINAPDITTEPELANFDLSVNVTITPWTEKNVIPGI
jgi:hypothetical protein